MSTGSSIAHYMVYFCSNSFSWILFSVCVFCFIVSLCPTWVECSWVLEEGIGLRGAGLTVFYFHFCHIIVISIPKGIPLKLVIFCFPDFHAYGMLNTQKSCNMNPHTRKSPWNLSPGAWVTSFSFIILLVSSIYLKILWLWFSLQLNNKNP